MTDALGIHEALDILTANRCDNADSSCFDFHEKEHDEAVVEAAVSTLQDVIRAAEEVHAQMDSDSFSPCAEKMSRLYRLLDAVLSPEKPSQTGGGGK